MVFQETALNSSSLSRVSSVRSPPSRSTTLESTMPEREELDKQVVLFECASARITNFASSEFKNLTTNREPSTSPSSPSQRILARGTLKLYQIKAHNSTFIQCGTIIHPIMRRSQVWKLAEYEYIFSLPTTGAYWRLKIDSSDNDVTLAFEKTLSEICLLQHIAHFKEDRTSRSSSPLEEGSIAVSPTVSSVQQRKANFERPDDTLPTPEKLRLGINKIKISEDSLGTVKSLKVDNVDLATPGSPPLSPRAPKFLSDRFTATVTSPTPSKFARAMKNLQNNTTPALKPSTSEESFGGPPAPAPAQHWISDLSRVGATVPLSFAQQERNRASMVPNSTPIAKPKPPRRKKPKRVAPPVEVTFPVEETTDYRAHQTLYSMELDGFGWTDLQYDATDLSYQPYGLKQTYASEFDTVVADEYSNLNDKHASRDSKVAEDDASTRNKDGKFALWRKFMASWLPTGV
ncbi:inheritance of peroxisomes protein 1-domain-containing protein [Lipomyces arxii]|uniref:inheritance of peroxisomes protein 1-domain-containing protein n=1 Tax=Lipomyces arxii TaxID=56418 RepID=UPI0034CFD176